MKIFVNVLLILLASCITIGAFNLVNSTDNRPMSLQELIDFVAELDLPIQDFLDEFYKIAETWKPTTYAGPGGSPGNQGGGGNIDTDNDRYNGFCSVDWVSNSGIEWLDGILNFLNDFAVSVLVLIKIAYMFVKYTILIFIQYFDFITKILFGVPI